MFSCVSILLIFINIEYVSDLLSHIPFFDLRFDHVIIWPTWGSFGQLSHPSLSIFWDTYMFNIILNFVRREYGNWTTFIKVLNFFLMKNADSFHFLFCLGIFPCMSEFLYMFTTWICLSKLDLSIYLLTYRSQFKCTLR